MFAAPLGSAMAPRAEVAIEPKAGQGRRSCWLRQGNSCWSWWYVDSFFEPIESEAWTEGSLDRNAIAAVINRHLSEVRFCSGRVYKRHQIFQVAYAMNFIIGALGNVTTAKINNSSLGHARNTKTVFVTI